MPKRAAAKRAALSAKKKVAVAKTLAATIHGVRVASSPSLIQKAREKGAAYSATTGPRTWFDDLRDRDPVSAIELCELVSDWHSFGPTRGALPTIAAVYRFAVDEIGISVKQNQFSRWFQSRRGA